MPARKQQHEQKDAVITLIASPRPEETKCVLVLGTGEDGAKSTLSFGQDNGTRGVETGSVLKARVHRSGNFSRQEIRQVRQAFDTCPPGEDAYTQQALYNMRRRNDPHDTSCSPLLGPP